ncbi:helix-turn-helix transcriptional regulator [Neolewinella antarctica]|uniref:Transcriptional regulator with XRE-family HTH domain n=1 Tax=Neolewinella antarctica TaxID=442734 RepID=A0ABX0X8B1_9BACT|nr:helix-turn-helix transcriptional regulator [Neolewinella antarctica]NJC25236.1 transcriptional regulator with XRE-family HTH domain [Neolewinella antarctica]
MKTAQTVEATQVSLPNFIGSNLRVLRKLKGWSQSQLAERVNLNRGNIASYESGNAEPSICKALRISKLFDVDPRDIIRRDLSDPQELLLAQIEHSQQEEIQRERLTQLRMEAKQLEELVRSSRTLFAYKRENIEQPCPAADLMSAHYEQLFEVTQQLLRNHQDLLNEVGCQCD